MFTLSRMGVRYKSCETLGVDQIDLVYLQDPPFSRSIKHINEHTTLALQRLQQEGVIRYYG